MENDIIDGIRDIGYYGPLTDENKLINAVQGGPKDIEFTQFVHFLTNEIRVLCNIDEHVNPIKAPEDSISFLLELSSFLKELGCPYENLTQGHMSDRLSTVHDRYLLLDYLICELMAARMVAADNPEKSMELKLQESSTASDLKQLLLSLKFPKPPANVTASMLFQKVLPKLLETAKHAGEDLVGRPLFSGVLTEQQWNELETVQIDLDKDYTIRREMLLKRLDCTIQSFQWSDRLKGKEDQIVQIYHNKRKNLKVDPGIKISDLLAAREDLAIIEKTSNASVRKNTQSSLNKLIIGQVPDRGGRPSEQAPPPPEMPSWQQRSAPAGGRGGGRGGQNNFSRGGGNDNFSRGGGQDNFSRGGGQDNFSRGGGNNFNQPQNYENNRGAQYNQTQSFDNNRGGGNYSEPYGNYNNQSNFGGGFNQQNKGGAYNERGYGNRGGANSARSFDSFQHNKSNYADQFVQDSQQNRQYSGRGDRDYDSPRGQRRGRSNYNRGNFR